MNNRNMQVQDTLPQNGGSGTAFAVGEEGNGKPDILIVSFPSYCMTIQDKY